MKVSCRLIWSGCLLMALFQKAAAQPEEALRANLEEPSPDYCALKDTACIDGLNARAKAFYGISADSAFYYSKKALACSQRSGYDKGQAESWRRLGNAYEAIGDYSNMLSCYQHSLNIAERIHNDRQIAWAHLNISLFYKDMGEYDAALQQMEQVTRICKYDGDSLQLAYVLGDQSDIYYRRRNYDKALQYAMGSKAIVKALNDSYYLASINNDIGKILGARKDYRESLVYLEPSLKYYEQRGDKLGSATSSILLARTWLGLGNTTEAIRYGSKGLLFARESGRKKELRDAGKVLADIYEARGDYRNSLHYFQFYKDVSDSLFDEATRKKTFAQEARIEYARKELLMKEDEARNDARQKQIVRNHFHQISIAILLILCLSALAITLFHRGMDRKRSNLLLQAKNQEIHRQKEEIEHQAVQLLLNNQQKDKLFSIISHDLKGPLNSLQSLLDFLKENSLTDSEINSMMTELRRNVDYSAELVNNLLYWAGSQLDGIVAQPVILNIAQLTTDTMTLFTKQAADKGICLKSTIPGDYQGVADKDMTQVIIRNLLSNAIKFCRSGDTITVCANKLDNGYIEFCVADTGIGIPSDLLEKIKRNESISTYGTAKEKGTGLGFLLCKEFAEAGKGQFWIESEWGHGTRIYFTIPAAPISSSINV